MKKKISLQLANQLLSVIILLASSQGFTQTAEEDADRYNDWYQIEFIIFKNLDDNARLQEQWPTKKQLVLSKDTRSLNELLNIPWPRALQVTKKADQLALLQLEQDLTMQQSLSEAQSLLREEAIDTTAVLIKPTRVAEESSVENLIQEVANKEQPLLTENKLASTINFIPAQEEQLVLDHKAKQLKYNRKYQVIYHGAWQQQLSDGQPIASYRLAVEKDGNQLDGTISVIRKRFVHVATDFWMHETASNTTAIKSRLKQENIQPLNNSSIIEADTPDHQTKQTIEYARLYKKERMRSNELHYIDHPLMGMLIQITPFKQLKPI